MGSGDPPQKRGGGGLKWFKQKLPANRVVGRIRISIREYLSSFWGRLHLGQWSGILNEFISYSQSAFTGEKRQCWTALIMMLHWFCVDWGCKYAKKIFWHFQSWKGKINDWRIKYYYQGRKCSLKSLKDNKQT